MDHVTRKAVAKERGPTWSKEGDAIYRRWATAADDDLKRRRVREIIVSRSSLRIGNRIDWAGREPVVKRILWYNSQNVSKS